MSLVNSRLKFLASLKQKKFRREHGLFVVEGEKLAAEALAQNRIQIDSIYGYAEWIESNLSAVQKKGIVPAAVSQKELSRISNLKTPNKVLVVCKNPIFELDKSLVINDLTLFLDQIRDPGNLGTIIRIADWFGIQQVILSPESAEIYNPKVVQSTMGGLFRVRVFELPFGKLKSACPNVPIYATTMDGTNVNKVQNKEATIIVIGNESHGVSDEILGLVDQQISIPLHKNGGAESLNAAVATGIICAAFRNMTP